MDSFVGEGEGGPVVEIGVPEGFGCDSESLAFEFSVDDLDGNFVPGDSEVFDFGSDEFCELFSDFAGVGEIVLGAFKFVIEDFLDDFPGSGRVEDFIRKGLQLVSVSGFGHYVPIYCLFKLICAESYIFYTSNYVHLNILSHSSYPKLITAV